MGDRPVEDQICSTIAQVMFEQLLDELMFHPEHCAPPSIDLTLTELGEPGVYPLVVSDSDGVLYEVDVDVTVSRRQA
jgi:hypothetical protein